MKKVRWSAVIWIVLAEFIFLFLVFATDLFRGRDANRIPFRQHERAAAVMAFAYDPTPEKKAAWVKEAALLSKHEFRMFWIKFGTAFVIVLCVDVVVAYTLHRSHNQGSRVRDQAHYLPGQRT